MKKVIAIILAVTFLCLLCGCDGGGTPQPKSYTATVKNVKVKIDADATQILQSLGEWTTYGESPSCAFEGLDKIYGYGAFDILTYPSNGKDYVSGIYLNDDSFATEEGIAVGADKEAVIKAYGEPDSQSDTYLRYEGEGMSLTFLLKNNRVSSVQYVKNT